ncbi:MAG: glutamate--tRNA ligase [Flavobacteriaceae bacterium]
MAKPIRVRFAPSPTGPLHVGGVRTALYNYLYAKKHGGQFVLRVEDTDQKRSVRGAEEYIQSSLEWLGIHPDESPIHSGEFGPYRQSERQHIYNKYILKLVERGDAYYAFDAAEDLDRHRKDHEKKGKTFVYNWHNRMKLNNSLVLGEEETKKRIQSGHPYVIRFLMWKEDDPTTLTFHDIVRGNVEVDCKLLDDKILYKSDGMPTYHFANVVDDHLMEISHVIRGEEWLPSLALHQRLYKSFGWESPIFAHLPLILKPSGKGKLSKRDGDKLGFPVFPIQWEEEITGYREEGFLPEAVLNFLALLGWNDGSEQEVFTLSEMISLFDLKKVHHAGARFDPEKNRWFNQQHIQRLSLDNFSDLCKSVVENQGFDVNDANKLTSMAKMIQPRVVLTTDIWNEISVFFECPCEYDSTAIQKVWKEKTARLLGAVADRLSSDRELTPEELKGVLKEVAESAGFGLGAIMGPLRLVLVGSLTGPDLIALIKTLGVEEVSSRIRSALDTIE